MTCARLAIVGYGYMGRVLHNVLRRTTAAEVVVVDPHPPDRDCGVESFSDLGALFSAHPPARLDGVLVASPTPTHAQVLLDLLRAGVTNVYVEKPAVQTFEEYRLVGACLGPETRIAVGYLLNESAATVALQRHRLQLERQGCHLARCHVRYGKDKTRDPRRHTDIGVHEELPHVVELLGNGTILATNAVVRCRSMSERMDPNIDGRAIGIDVVLDASRNGSRSIIQIAAAFDSPEKTRCFDMTFIPARDGGSPGEFVRLTFDTLGVDQLLRRAGPERAWAEVCVVPSQQKLDDLLRHVLAWFAGGVRAPTLHAFEDTERVLHLWDLVKTPGHHPPRQPHR